MLLFGKMTFAQSNFAGYFMPLASVNYNLNEKFSQHFEFENRNFTYLNNDFEFKAIHVEFTHLTKYQYRPNHRLGLGVKYRFQSIEGKENEFRLTQQYEWDNGKEALLKHRVRVEERIYTSITKFRLRYRTAMSFKTKAFCDEVSISNELGLEVNKETNPEYEERVVVEAGWQLTKKSKFVLGTQYRLTDFTATPKHNVFLTAGLNFNL